MQYIEYAKLGMAAITLLVQLIKDLKSKDGTDSDAAVDRGVSFLAHVGEIAKVKELSAENLTALVPSLRELVKEIKELKKLSLAQ